MKYNKSTIIIPSSDRYTRENCIIDNKILTMNNDYINWDCNRKNGMPGSNYDVTCQNYIIKCPQNFMEQYGDEFINDESRLNTYSVFWCEPYTKCLIK